MLKNNAYASKITSSTFETTIPDKDLRSAVLRSFKDEYLLDFVNIEDPDAFDERILENRIVHNIKNFIMTFGDDFAFMGNYPRSMNTSKDRMKIHQLV